MLLRKLKWRGGPRPTLVWSHEVTPLGDDEHGQWFFAPCGTPVVHADGVVHEQWADALVLFAADHVASVWRPEPGGLHGDLRLTVDVAHRIQAPEYVDLELDVFGWEDGRLEGRDEDELAAALATGALPPSAADAARATFDTLLAQVDLTSRLSLWAGVWWGRVDRG